MRAARGDPVRPADWGSDVHPPTSGRRSRSNPPTASCACPGGIGRSLNFGRCRTARWRSAPGLSIRPAAARRAKTPPARHPRRRPRYSTRKTPPTTPSARIARSARQTHRRRVFWRAAPAIEFGGWFVASTRPSASAAAPVPRGFLNGTFLITRRMNPLASNSEMRIVHVSHARAGRKLLQLIVPSRSHSMVTAEQILRLSGQIAGQFAPEKIVLFGSYAYGDPTEDSDVDLLVAMNSKCSELDKSIELRMAVDVTYPLDMLVRRPRILRQRVRWGDCFLIEILEKGLILHERANERVGQQGRRRLRNRLTREDLMRAV